MTDTELAIKCMDFCQALAAQGQTTSLNITIGSSFSFNLDTRVRSTTKDTTKANLDPKLVSKKRKSPSTLRRNEEKKVEFLKQKLALSSNTTPPNPLLSDSQTPQPLTPNPSPPNLPNSSPTKPPPPKSPDKRLEFEPQLMCMLCDKFLPKSKLLTHYNSTTFHCHYHHYCLTSDVKDKATLKHCKLQHPDMVETVHHPQIYLRTQNLVNL